MEKDTVTNPTDMTVAITFGTESPYRSCGTIADLNGTGFGSCEPCWKTGEIWRVEFQEVAAKNANSIWPLWTLWGCWLRKHQKLSDDESDPQVVMAIDVWKSSDYLCRNYVMNCLAADSLYNVYSSKKTAKELWDSLDHKSKTEDDGT